MQTDKKITFYTDLTKHHEFISRLNSILNNKESSVSDCYLSSSTMGAFYLNIISKSNFENSLFNFSNFFSRGNEKNDYFYQSYLNRGLSKQDIDLFSDFLDEFAFTNRFEGDFFASRFFENELNKKNHNRIYFKFTPSEKNNNHLVSGKKLSRHYTVESETALGHLLNNEDVSNQDSKLTKINTYSFSNIEKIQTAIVHLEDKNKIIPHDKNYIVEHFKDLEYYVGYIANIYDWKDGKLIDVDIKKFVN